MKPIQFVRQLEAFRGGAVFNPYRDRCEVYDRYNGPVIRRRNLRNLLQAMELYRGQCDLWIGRDLGYLGGRRTGLALTAESHLDVACERWGIDLRQATIGLPVKERSANAIWGLLATISYPIMMWNVFPFHPHDPDNPFTNRSHTAEERALGLEYLKRLIDWLSPRQLVAIGNDAANITRQHFPKTQTVAVRHPSYGGQTTFARQVSDIYQVPQNVLKTTSSGLGEAYKSRSDSR